MILKCALVDDEPLALDLLEAYVSRTPFLQLVGKYSSAIAAMDALQQQRIDLLFLDIQMPELSGLEFSKIVPAETRIVFTTAFGQYALEGYRVNALDYLLKPISYNDFLEAANKAMGWFEMKNHPSAPVPFDNECIYVKSEYKLIQILLRDILYVEGMKDYVKIFTETQPKPIISLMSMKTVEEHLPSDYFIRVHRSFIVQKGKIKVVDRGRIVFGREYIPISESYKDALQNYLNEKMM